MGCEHEKLRNECARSMPFEWDPNRFRKAARLYRQDVDNICLCLDQQKQGKKAKALHEFDVKLSIQKKLAESLGRSIRYHLRRLFNPVYGPVTVCETFEEQKKGNDDNDVFKRPSNMSQILQMRLPDWYSSGDTTAVADGSVSSVLNVALETIVNYFGVDMFLAGKEFILPSIPKSFCSSAAAKQGLQNKSDGMSISVDEVDSIVTDTVDAQRFLAAAKACKFIKDLFMWPGVEEEVVRLGGWTLVEERASEFESHHLDRFSQNDAHLVVLKSIPELLKRVDQCWSHLKDAAQDCTDALDDLWIKFKCDSVDLDNQKKKSRKSKKSSSSAEVSIKRVLIEGLEYHMFPNITEPDNFMEEEEEEEDNSESEQEEK